MTILIGQITPDEQTKYHITNYLTIKNICKLDKKDVYTIYIMNTEINEFGLIKGTDIILDELLITYNIKTIYYKLDNNEYILNACSYYGVMVCAL